MDIYIIDTIQEQKQKEVKITPGSREYILGH